MKNVKLANFDNPKWTYDNLKQYARKYRNMLKDKEIEDNTLAMYQCMKKDELINKLKVVQKKLYKE